MKISKLLALTAIAGLMVLSNSASAENIWDLQAVDSDGVGTHPKVGADVGNPDNMVVIEGIALNAPSEILDVSDMWQVYVQGQSPDQGGIAVFSGRWWWGASWCPYPLDVAAGDILRVTGFVANHNGKVNLNERHSQANAFTVEVVERGAGMPEPILIPNISDCNYFDQSRGGSGELYQCQWVKLESVNIQSGAWGAGNEVAITDVSGATVTMLLSSEGDFDSYSAPTGSFDVVGIFDQEDTDSPYHEKYRLWVKSYSDIAVSAGIEDWHCY